MYAHWDIKKRVETLVFLYRDFQVVALKKGSIYIDPFFNNFQFYSDYKMTFKYLFILIKKDVVITTKIVTTRVKLVCVNELLSKTKIINNG